MTLNDWCQASNRKAVNNTETTFEEPWRDLSPPSELCTPQRVRLASISDVRLNSPISWHIPGPLSWRIGDRAVLLTQKCHKLNNTCYGTITSSQAETADWFQGTGAGTCRKWAILGRNMAIHFCDCSVNTLVSDGIVCICVLLWLVCMSRMSLYTGQWWDVNKYT